MSNQVASPLLVQEQLHSQAHVAVDCATPVAAPNSLGAYAPLESSSLNKPTASSAARRRKWVFIGAALVLLTFVVVVAGVVYADSRRTPQLRLIDVHASARHDAATSVFPTSRIASLASNLASADDTLAVHSQLRLFGGPRHSKLTLHAASCAVSVQVSASASLQPLFVVDVLPQQDHGQALQWTGGEEDAEDQAVSLLVHDVQADSVHALLQDALLGTIGGEAQLQIDCSLSAQVHVFGTNTGTWNLKQQLHTPVTNPPPSGMVPRTSSEDSTTSMFVPVPIRVQRSGVFASLRSLQIDTPLVRSHAMLNIDCAHMSQPWVNATEFVQWACAQQHRASAVELTVQPAQLQLAPQLGAAGAVASSPLEEYPTVQFTARLLALDSEDACNTTLAASDLPALPSGAMVAVDVLSCAERQNHPGRNVIARIMGAHNRVAVAVTSTQAKQGKSQQACAMATLNNRPVDDVSACAAWVPDSSRSDTLDVSIDLLAASLFRGHAQLNLDLGNHQHNVYVAHLASQLVFRDASASNAALDVSVDLSHDYSAVFSASVSESHASRVGAPLTPRLQAAYSGQAVVGGWGPFGGQLSGSTSWRQELLSQAQVQVKVDTNAKRVELSVVENKEPAADMDPAAARFSAVYGATWSNDDNVVVMVSGKAYLEAECRSQAIVGFALSQGSAAADVSLLEVGNAGPLSPATARIHAAYSGSVSVDASPYGGSVSGSTTYEQQMASNAAVSVHVDTHAHTASVSVAESAAASLAPSDARFAAAYSATWGINDGVDDTDDVAVQVTGSTYVQKRCRSQAQLGFALMHGNTAADVSLLEVGNAGPLLPATARVQAAYSGVFAYKQSPYGGSISGATSIHQALATRANVTVYADTEAQRVSVNITETTDAESLAPTDARFAAAYTGEYITGNGFALSVIGSAYTDEECRSQAQFDVAVDTEAGSGSIALIEAGSAGPLDKDTARIDVAYSGAASVRHSPYGGGVSGTTVINQRLLEHVDASVFVDTRAHSVAVNVSESAANIALQAVVAWEHDNDSSAVAPSAAQEEEENIVLNDSPAGLSSGSKAAIAVLCALAGLALIVAAAFVYIKKSSRAGLSGESIRLVDEV